MFSNEDRGTDIWDVWFHSLSAIAWPFYTFRSISQHIILYDATPIGVVIEKAKMLTLGKREEHWIGVENLATSLCSPINHLWPQISKFLVFIFLSVKQDDCTPSCQWFLPAVKSPTIFLSFWAVAIKDPIFLTAGKKPKSSTFYFLVMRTLKIYCLNNFQIRHPAVQTIVIVLYITPQDLVIL